MKIVDYKVISSGTKIGFSNHTKKIEEEVKSHIQEGWQPVGGVFAAGSIFYQAMVKYEG
jgi:hypothetical protein